jgi:hypothetical protein
MGRANKMSLLPGLGLSRNRLLVDSGNSGSSGTVDEAPGW